MEKAKLPPKQRMQALYDYFGMNPTSFNESIGFKRGRTEAIADGKTASISLEVAMFIVKKYPMISKRWLLTGDGDMITTYTIEEQSPGVSTPPNNSELIQELRNQIAEQKATIERLNNKIDAMEEQYAKERRELRDSHERIMLDAQQKHKEAEESQLRTVNTLCRAMQVNSQQANDVIQGNKYLSPTGNPNGGYGVADPMHAHKRININDK